MNNEVVKLIEDEIVDICFMLNDIKTKLDFVVKILQKHEEDE